MTKKIGVIGLGSIGRRHVNNLLDIGGCQIFGYDPDTTLTGSIVQKWDGKYAKNLDAVVIASPTDCHHDHILDCSGTPTFVEKPITDGSVGLDTLATASTLMVGYNLRFHGCVVYAKAWLDGGFIGRPLWANFTLAQRSDKPPYLRSGVILNWSHEIDLALHLLGRGSLVGSSTRLSNGRDDLTDILFTHTSGCRSTIHLDYTTEPEVRQSIIVGKNGTIIMDLVSHNAWLRNKKGEITDHHQASSDWNDTYVEEMKAFLKRVDGINASGCTAEEGLAVLDICLEVRKQAGL